VPLQMGCMIELDWALCALVVPSLFVNGVDVISKVSGVKFAKFENA
jgi:hypothetical protein